MALSSIRGFWKESSWRCWGRRRGRDKGVVAMRSDWWCLARSSPSRPCSRHLIILSTHSLSGGARGREEIIIDHWFVVTSGRNSPSLPGLTSMTEPTCECPGPMREGFRGTWLVGGMWWGAVLWGDPRAEPYCKVRRRRKGRGWRLTDCFWL